MVVVKTGRLAIFTKESIREAQRDTETMKSIAQEQERILLQVRKSRGTNITRQGSTNFLGTGSQDSNLPRSVVRRQRKLDEGGQGRIAQQPIFDNRAPKAKSTSSGAAFQRVNKLEAKINRQDNIIRGIQSTQAKIFGGAAILSGGPQSIATSALSSVSKFFPPAILASIIVPIVYDTLETANSRGGLNDPSLKNIEATKSLIGLGREDTINAGVKLFLGDPTLKQGVPTNTSNTSDLRHGSRQYVLRSNPYGR